jgi:hypothetical protein
MVGALTTSKNGNELVIVALELLDLERETIVTGVLQ